MLATVPLVGAGLGILAESRAVPRLAAEVAARAGPDDLLVHEGPIEASGALELYSGRRPALLDGTRSVLGFGSTFRRRPRDVLDVGALPARAGSRTGRCTSSRRARPSGASIAAMPPDRVRLVLEHNGRRLYVNAGAAQPSR